MTDRVVIVSGATGVGKSALALALALELGAEIVSLDSVQVFAGCVIGSNAPSAEEQRLVPHHLVGSIPPNYPCNAGWYLQQVLRCCQEIAARGKPVIIVGGTTMYLSTLLAGLDALPPRDATLRARIDTAPAGELHQMLAVLDPARAAQLHPQDRHRIVRALEVAGLSREEPSATQPLRLAGPALVIVPVVAREVLYARLDERTRRMFSQGILEETSQILAQYGADAPALKAIGYSQALEVIQAHKTLEQGIAETAQATRNYAKRQMTFFKNEPRKRGWVQNPPQTGAVEGGKGNEPRDLYGSQTTLPELLQQVRGWLQQPVVPHREVWFRQLA